MSRFVAFWKEEFHAMGPWYFAGLMAILFVLLIVYAKTGRIW